MAVLALFLMLLRCSSGVQVETRYGTVEGQTITLVDDYHAGIAVNSFYAVPYARPPVGELRFEPPEEPEPWEGVFVADTLGDACSQSVINTILIQQPGWDSYSEDCLHMNVFAPADQSGGPYPVVVYIHGGSYQMGANVQHVGHFMAARGLVYVVPNYRLGVFGFAYTGDGVIQGNMGLMDQAAALQFVQDNIEAFGGNPDQVTLMGQSAGAAGVGLQLLSPRTEGLFHQAIMQSGSDLVHWAVNQPSQNPEQYIRQTAEQVDCPTEDTQEMVDCLKTKTREELQNTTVRCEEAHICLGMVPVVDGPGGYLPDTPQNLRERGEFKYVTEFIGYNQNDAFEFTLLLGPGVWFGGPNRTEFQYILRRQVEFYGPRVPDRETREEDIYQGLDFYFSPWPRINDRELNRHALGEIMTDTNYGYTAERQARFHSEHAAVYKYVYSYVSQNATTEEWMGCTHSEEVSFVTGRVFIRHNPDVREETGIVDDIGYLDEDDDYAYYFMTLWTNFAKYGNPTPDPVEPPAGLPASEWLPYSMEDFNYMYLGREAAETRQNYRQHEYSFWIYYLPYLVYREDEMPDEDVYENPSRGEMCPDGTICLSFKDAFYNREDKIFQAKWWRDSALYEMDSDLTL